MTSQLTTPLTNFIINKQIVYFKLTFQVYDNTDYHFLLKVLASKASTTVWEFQNTVVKMTLNYLTYKTFCHVYTLYKASHRKFEVYTFPRGHVYKSSPLTFKC